MKFFSARMLSLAALLSAAFVIGERSSAQAILIDSFSQPQDSVSDPGTIAGATIGSIDPLTIGTELPGSPDRQIISQTTTGTGHTDGEVRDGLYFHSQEGATQGRTQVIYTNFGPADLTADGAFLIALNVVSADITGGKAIIHLFNGATEGAVSRNIPVVDEDGGDPPQTLIFPFISFAGIDPTQVDKVILEIDGSGRSNFDVSVDLLSATTPEPSSLLLLGSGLLGLGWLRRRQKNS